MAMAEGMLSQDYFAASQRIWFPDFEEMIVQQKTHYEKLGPDFSCFLILLRYFRKALSRAQFAKDFLAQEAPRKMLRKQRELYQRVCTLCRAYEAQSIFDTELDAQLLLAFRDRPAEDVFTPDFSLWDEVTHLMSLLDTKSKRLPHHFDGMAWNRYLSGSLTRKEYTERYLAFGTVDHLAQIAAYGIDKDRFAEEYATEISVCQQLHKLCQDYRDCVIFPASFDLRFLELAREFCGDLME